MKVRKDGTRVWSVWLRADSGAEQDALLANSLMGCVRHIDDCTDDNVHSSAKQCLLCRIGPCHQEEGPSVRWVGETVKNGVLREDIVYI